MLWNTGLAQGNTETNELGYTSGLKRMFLFSECKTLPDFASITIAAYGAANPQKGNDTNRNIAISFLMPVINSLGIVFLKHISFAGGLFSAFYPSVATELQNLNVDHIKAACMPSF